MFYLGEQCNSRGDSPNKRNRCHIFSMFCLRKEKCSGWDFPFFCTVVSFRLAVKETKDFFLKNEEGKKKYMLKVSSYN